MSSDTPEDRSNLLIEHGRFITLATSGPEGIWASTVNFVPLREPLRLLWYSQAHVRHSRNIAATPQVAGSIFLTGLSTKLGLDGAQLTGTARPIEDPRQVAESAEFYYTRNFPDDQVRAQWQLPLAEFHDGGHRRFYELTVTEWWLFDIDHWLATRNDKRIAVNLDMLQQTPAEASK